jgi:hypothetical protein
MAESLLTELISGIGCLVFGLGLNTSIGKSLIKRRREMVSLDHTSNTFLSGCFSTLSCTFDVPPMSLILLRIVGARIGVAARDVPGPAKSARGSVTIRW